MKTTQYVNAPPGLTYPGDPGFQGKAGVNSQWNLWVPRVALAWDPKGDGKTVIRASFGIAYDYVARELLVNSADAPPFGGTEMWAGQFSNPYATNVGGNIFPYTVNAQAPFAKNGTYIYVPQNLKATSVNQWNLVVQRQLGKEWLLSATYIGSESEHLWDSFQVNPSVYIPGTCQAGQYGLTAAGPCSPSGDTNAQARRLFSLAGYPGSPYYGYVESLDSGRTASYQGLVLAVTKRLSKGFLANANYTWSHCIGDLSIGDSTGNAGGGLAIPNNRNYDRSNCQSNEIAGTFSSDRRQVFNLTLVYQTPKFSNTWATRFLSNWQVAGIWRYTSAYWLTASLSSDVALNEDSPANQRPVQVLANPLCANPGPSCWINPAAFQTPALGTLSATGRDNIPGPTFFRFDTALSRQFSIREKGILEFRAEAFNVTNSFIAGISLPSLAAGASGVSTTFGTPTFGQITSAQDPRILQLAMRFTF